MLNNISETLRNFQAVILLFHPFCEASDKQLLLVDYSAYFVFLVFLELSENLELDIQQKQ